MPAHAGMMATGPGFVKHPGSPKTFLLASRKKLLSDTFVRRMVPVQPRLGAGRNREMSKKTNATETETATETTAKPRKAPKRKPVYVFVPVEPETLTIDGDEERSEETVRVVPDGVTLYECHLVEGGDGQTDTVRDILKDRMIDRSNVADVLLFRAAPIDFELRMKPQLILRPRKD